MPEDSGEISDLLQRWVQGDKKALAALAPLVYDELRRLAHNQLRAERRDHTLQSTALVNEAFGRLLAGKPVALQNRDHFVAIAARLMRQILVQYARDRQALKRDGGCRVALEDVGELSAMPDAQIIELDDALQHLAELDERQGQIVEMKFFGGLTMTEIARVLEISVATVERDWSTARIWLHREIQRNSEA
jgi:RNA polymerase sigma factor (TIGR02999 family)